ncbi:hypothetical protein [uncultured Maritimibacter sp.]|jgi:hypothetical protein|uniref:hypothetical protein n=1 Tax=uncultured Maritimibacter sp. TaxID=991866 RepID=UPI002624E171|nr:hypothetical protein [uncultured Maritimibacter sp.]
MQIYDRRISTTRRTPVALTYFDRADRVNRPTGHFSMILDRIGHGTAPDTPQAAELARL